MIVKRFNKISFSFYITGQGCPHVKKAVNFMAMRKVVLKEKLGDCRVSYCFLLT